MNFLAGLGLGLSLIVAIGAQNVFVLRQGLRKEHVGWVVLICAVSDAALIVLGVSGMGAAIVNVPWLATGARWGGAAFLLVYAVLAARRAWRPSLEVMRAEGSGLDLASESDGDASRDVSGVISGVTSGDVNGDVNAEAVGRDSSEAGDGLAAGTLRATLLTCLALTWLNPHVYLDTVFLLGTVAATHGDARWLFAAGAVTASVLWFASLGYGARLLNRWLTQPSAWRVLDGAIAAIMTVLAIMLAAGA